MARPTVDSGWGYCTDDCKIGFRPSSGKLQIIKLDLLKSTDCEKLLRGTNATKVLDKNKQLCAGLKLARKPTPVFFTYSGEGRNMTFHEMKKPLKNWKPAHMSTVPGLNFMIGEKDTCRGDSGGPLWVHTFQKRETMSLPIL